jgi:hypothetical protein
VDARIRHFGGDDGQLGQGRLHVEPGLETRGLREQHGHAELADRQVHEFSAARQRNITIGFAVQLDEGRHVLNLGDDRVGHAAIHYGYCCHGASSAPVAAARKPPVEKPSSPIRPELSGRAKIAVTTDETRLVHPSYRPMS